MSRTVGWFSAGAASAIACHLAKPDVIAYCHTGAEDVDNARFLGECEYSLFGRRVEILRSDTYRDTWDVWQRRKYLAGTEGAPCTLELKVRPRLAMQRPDDIHIFGYTADAADAARADALREHWPDLTVATPLIERGLTKAACIAMIQRLGITPPRVYDLGFPNANCIPCVKATSPRYWSLVRRHFPDKFDRMAQLSREMGVKLTRIDNERIFIDQIPADFPVTNPIAPECDFLCQIAEHDL